MEALSERIEAIADVAAEWRDPEHPPRAAAVEETLAAPNRWTEAALEHALNRWMQCLTVERLTKWLGDERPAESVQVGVLHAETEPVAGLRDALAVWALGHSYVGHVPASSPALLPAIAEALRGQGLEVQARFTEREEVLEAADALVAEPDSEEEVHEKCEEAGIPEERRLIRPPVYSVGVVDGHESEDEMGRLAEDMLLYEGQGRRRLALLWAPRDHSPDDYLEAMAHFRGLFPAHEDTPGTLQMQQAFLEARDQPHAYADGLEFLMSRGEPEVQRTGHVRWTEYDGLEAVADWLGDRGDAIYSVIARSDLHDRLPAFHTIRTPGGVHVPPLDDWEGEETVAFLREIAA
jgi:hypothetical protein